MIRTFGLHTRGAGDSKAELGLRPTLAIYRGRTAFPAEPGPCGTLSEPGWGSVRIVFSITFTTPDVAVETFAKKEYERAKMVAPRTGPRTPDYLPVLFEPEPEDDPFDRKTWIKAAPALESGFLDWAAYESEAAEARLDPTALHAFKVYRCALSGPTSGHGYLDMTLWDKSVAELTGAGRN